MLGEFTPSQKLPPMQLLTHSLPVVCHVNVTPIGWSALPRQAFYSVLCAQPKIAQCPETVPWDKVV